LDDYKIQNAGERLGGRGDPAYQKILATGSQLADLEHLNTTHGVSSETFTRFLHDHATRQREEDADPSVIQQKRRETATSRISNGSCTTAGLFVCDVGKHVNVDALAIIKRTKDKKEQERLEKETKKLKERKELKRKFKFNILLANGNYSNRWNVADLEVVVQLFKLPADPVMPARKQELVERYEHAKLRKVQDVAYLDDENDYAIIDAVFPGLNKNDDKYEAGVAINVTMNECVKADNSEEIQSDDEFELIDWTAGIN
jgi:hypothetical protein